MKKDRDVLIMQTKGICQKKNRKVGTEKEKKDPQQKAECRPSWQEDAKRENKRSLSSCGRSRSYRGTLSSSRGHTVDLTSLRTVLRDVAHLAASVAGFGSFAIHGATVWRGAVSGDMAKLAASIALHCLSLTITGKVVGSAALVASRRTRVTTVASTHATTTGVRATRRSTGAVALSAFSPCSVKIAL